MTERVYGDLGGLPVEVRASTVPKRPGFLGGVGLFIFFGLIFSTLGFFGYSGPVDWGSILVQLLWGALIGGVVGIPVSAAVKQYGLFPRAMLGHIQLYRVENHELWFYGEDGKRHQIGLRKRVINVHDETTIHLGALVNVLELKTQTQSDMDRLSSALKPEVKIFPHYGDSDVVQFR